MAVLGLRFCARAFSSCGKWRPLFIAMRGPLTIAASLVVEHRLQTRRLSNCGSRAQLLRGMWDLPGPGLEPVSPALAGGFLTTAPPGKPRKLHFGMRCSEFGGCFSWVIKSLPGTHRATCTKLSPVAFPRNRPGPRHNTRFPSLPCGDSYTMKIGLEVSEKGGNFQNLRQEIS